MPDPPRTSPAASAADHRLARVAAESAGEMLVALRAELAGRLDPWAVGDEGDRRAHGLLIDLLRREAPEDAVLSEEGLDDRARLGSRRVWIIDPLDGTREFREPGRVDWAVHVALVIDEVVAAGAVALPAMGSVLATDDPPVVPAPHDGPLRVIASRSRPPREATTLVEALEGRLLALGSAGAKAMAVVSGEADCYVHVGGQYEWDNAAPVAVALAAGLHASRLDGSQLRYNRSDPWSPDLLICRAELAPRILDALRRRAGP